MKGCEALVVHTGCVKNYCLEIQLLLMILLPNYFMIVC